MDPTIPPRVIALLAQVRASGLTNMIDWRGVIAVGGAYAEDAEDYAALDWLATNPRAYLAALKAMGATLRRR